MSDQPAGDAPVRIRVQVNGPYLVSGGIPLTRRRPIISEHGEPLAWDALEDFATTPTYSLCRCGGSANKPFCDGTHATNGFDGAETAPTDPYDERQRTYVGTRVVMRDDRSICEHAGFCGNRVTNVWNMMKGSDTEDSLARAQVMRMVEQCPSGALTYRLEPDGPDVEPEWRTAVGVVEGGPLFVTGRVAVERSDGQPLETRNRTTLCRCGGSAIKPLCDGSHQTNGFTDT